MSCHDLIDFHYHAVAKHSRSIATRVLHLLHCLIRKNRNQMIMDSHFYNATYCIFFTQLLVYSSLFRFWCFFIISFIYIIRKCVTKLKKNYSFFLNNQVWMKKTNKQTLIAVLFFWTYQDSDDLELGHTVNIEMLQRTLYFGWLSERTVYL